MPTVIQNGCTYRIVKTYHCGCEYEYNTPPSYDPFIDLLIVGGGGSGGSGGGGGGGVIVCEAYPLNKECSSYNICAGAAGNNSCFDNLIACRGGKGEYIQNGWYYPTSGGSGGGAGESGTGCPGIAGQGNKGGNGGYSGGCYGGGGGGAGEAGCNGTTSGGGKGGDGILNDFSGEACYYGGGGGGGTNLSGKTGGCGGLGGGGDGIGCPGNFYGGGGGGRSNSNPVSGYQGVVILRYKTDGTCGIKPSSTGGCKYTCGERTIHCFCNAGALETFNPVYN